MELSFGNEKTLGKKYGILGVPWDAGASLGKPGARYGPAKVREAIGWISNRIQGEQIAAIERQKIVDLKGVCIRDFGDVELVYDDYQKSFDNISAKVGELFEQGFIPLVIGGDHSVTYPLIRELHDRCSGTVGFIQFDAHLDLLDESASQGSYSQSSEIRRALELERVPAGNLVQVGVRGFNYPANFKFVKEEKITQYTPQQIRKAGPEKIAEYCLDIAGNSTEKIYLTLDIDVLDPVYAPGCGANEPGGLNIDEIEAMVDKLAPHIDCLDVVEVNPLFDLNDQTAAVAAKLLMDVIISGVLST